ncbi:hypothetical protein [Antarcticirhabdus aurantiaca]|uniref:Uncharacterized protein n=1 Tax=Antarcticirhabdus aurantiaca TaxID=2606717 RepID=A0ACD4NM33_9HYPH|nr:hypothetical protein [Antarcticirhabdus aurantiaca]WAJ27864.1 hypothetical protein OXU80_23965 [Jeongeuplla avenae]
MGKGSTSRDAVGLEAGMLTREELASCFRLVSRRLARVDLGWRRSVWFRLIARGWTLQAKLNNKDG